MSEKLTLSVRDAYIVPPNATHLDDFKVIVQFGKGVGPDLQGRALLAMESLLRDAGCPACVEKQTKADDSKLRISMTDEERKKL